MNRAIQLCLATLLAVSGTGRLNATPIIVPNFSFQLPVVGEGANSYSTSDGNTTVATNWIVGIPAPAGATGAGLYNPGNGQYPGATGGNLPAPADGTQAGFIYLDQASSAQTATLTSQNSLGTIQSSTLYTLTVAVGRRLDLASTNMEIALLANGTPIAGATSAINGATITAGTFVDLSASFTTSFVGPLIGQALTIRLTSSKSASDPIGEGEFDNVRLESEISAIPEPSTLALLGLGVIGMAIKARRRAG